MDARYIGRFGLELFRTKRSDVFPCGFSEQPRLNFVVQHLLGLKEELRFMKDETQATRAPASQPAREHLRSRSFYSR